MKFTRFKGKVVLDLAGDLVLTRGPRLVSGDSKRGASPAVFRNVSCFVALGSQGFINRLRATLVTLKWIWTDHT